MYLLLLSVLAIFFSVSYCDSSCKPSVEWMRESTLDQNGKIVIKWNFTDDDIIMMVSANTTGWLGIGFGPRREPFVDFIVGWVTDKNTTLQDRYINSKGNEPVLDKHQSIQLVGGSETQNSTYICFRRKNIACDDKDYTITDGTTKLTWAFGARDPIDENLQFQSATKGEKLMHLLSVVYPKPNSETYSITAPNTTVSSKMGNTLYWCSYHEVPPRQEETYFLGFDALIPKQSMGIVHHMSLYICNSDEMDKVYNNINPKGYKCEVKDNKPLLKYCRTMVAVWAMGGEDQYFPPSTGAPFGSTTTKTYYRQEIHYNIPPQHSEFIDSSSLQFYITKEKPKNVLSLLFTGYQVGPMLVVPPGLKNFSVIGACESKCLQENIPKSGITVVGIRFHAHMKGRQLKLHVFRDNKELKPIKEDNFDFEFQAFRFLKHELKFLPNDRLAIECTYDTTTSNHTIVGEESSDNEMCIIYLYYYPRMENIDMCLSFIKPENIMNLIGLQEISLPQGVEKCNGSDCQAPIALNVITPPITVLRPEKYANRTFDSVVENFNNWTTANIQKLTELYYGKQNPVCSGKGKVFYSKATDVVQYPIDAAPYVYPETCGNKQ